MGWKYEALFGTELVAEEGDLSRYWRSEPSGIPVGRMGYRRSTTVAGPRLECEIYPAFGREDERKAATAKKNQTKQAQKRLNRRRAVRHLIQLADKNFTERDIHLTLTYRVAPEWGRARKDVRNFLLRVKRFREKRGMEELKYIYSIEGGHAKKSGYGMTQIHVHMIMNGGISREMLEEMWQYGYANADRLKPNDYGLEELARYIVKENEERDERDRHGKMWCASRNLKQPKTRKTDAPVSNGKVKVIAKNIQADVRAEMEKMYPSYRFVDCHVYFSDQVDGVYIRVLMRKKGKRMESAYL